MLDFSLGTTILFIATIPELIALFISIRGYVTKKYPHFLFMSSTWFFMFIGTILLAIAYFDTNTELYRFAILANIPTTFSIMLLVDSVSRRDIDPLKLFVTTVVASAMTIYGFQSNAVKINVSYIGEHSPAMAGNFDVLGSLLFVLAGLYWLYYMVKIYIHAPQSIKRDALINMVGAIIAGPGAALAFGSGFVWYLPGTDYVCIAIGALFTSYAFMKQPKLGYVLSFKVYRIMTINSESGLALYSYDWDNELFEDQLFSGALIGISAILKESLNKGLIKEIEFEQGKLIVKQLEDYPIFFVLLANDSRPILHRALDLFSKAFRDSFPVEQVSEYIETSKFAKAKDLLQESFPFVVNYIDK